MSSSNNSSTTPINTGNNNNNNNNNGRALSKRNVRSSAGACQCRDGYTWLLGNCTIPQQVRKFRERDHATKLHFNLGKGITQSYVNFGKRITRLNGNFRKGITRLYVNLGKGITRSYVNFGNGMFDLTYLPMNIICPRY